MARKILLADDSVTAQNMGRRILSDAGYEVITVNNGSAALKKIAEIIPDLIVLDVYMPGYGGLEVCQRLKESQATARIPVLLTVGKLEPFKVDEARRVRADAHIVKPFDTTELLAAIIKLEDKIVPQPAAGKQGRSTKAGSNLETTRRGRDKSADAGSETTSGWKKRLSIPRSIPSTDVQDDAEKSGPKTVSTMFHDLAPRLSQQSPEAKLPEAPVALPATQEAGENSEPVRPFENFNIERLIAMENSPSEAVAPSVSPEGPTKPEPDVALPDAAAEAHSPDPPALETTAIAESPSPEPVTAEPSLTSREDASRAKQSPSEVEVMAALASLSPVSSHDSIPITALDAALAAVGTVCSGPRWIAEAVPLSDGDSHLILESEMEKTYAALAAAESAQTVAAAETKSDLSVIESVSVMASASSPLIESPTESQTVADLPAPELSSSVEAGTLAASEIAAACADSEMPSQATVESTLESATEPIEVKAAPAETAAAEEITSTAYREIAYAAAASRSSGAGIPGRSEVGTFANEFPVSPASPAAESLAPEPSNTVSVSADTGAPAELSEAVQAVTEVVPLTPEAPASNSEGQEHESELAAAWQNWKQIRESIVGPQLTSQITDVAAAGFKQIRGEEKLPSN
ncbi:MAG: response regulator, partial [Terriglobales bacterium]